MQPELISFKLCPFVQRSVITLKHKGVPFEVKYIDLENKPDWFLRLSPTGKVPVLKVGDTVLFESAVINEYLNDVNPPSMHPADPLDRARPGHLRESGCGAIVEVESPGSRGARSLFCRRHAVPGRRGGGATPASL